jgi:hypothetical protein
MVYAPPARHLLRAKDLADARFFEPLDVDDNRWSDESERINICGGKDLLRLLNRRLQAEGFKAVTDRQLARQLEPNEIPNELRQTLRTVAEL